ncbi:MAG: hypothetical protein JWM76_3342 [Pseudonocardiales bacterium]|nr:hypothetical protein [Pseudonocardiales bacterium]
MSILESPTINVDLVNEERADADSPANVTVDSTSALSTPGLHNVKSVLENLAPSPDPAEIFTDLADRLVASGLTRVTVELIDHNSLTRVVRPDPGAPTAAVSRPLAETQALFAGGGEAIVGPNSIAVAIHADAVTEAVRTTSGTDFLGSLICDFGPVGTHKGDLAVLELLVAATVTAVHRQRTADALSDKVANLEQALASNREIGVAMGILSARHNIRPQEAFELLRVASQHTNRKLRDLAAEVIQTGQLDNSERHLRLVSAN